MDKQCGIYVIQNLINNKCYVGQAQDIVARWKCEKWALNQEKPAWNKHLQRSWKKYGEDNFKFDVIEICNVDELNDREIYWISYFDSYHNGYNQTLGGDGCRGHVVSQETRDKIRKAAIGRYVSDETKAKLSVIHTGAIFTDERRAKIGEANRKRVYTDEQKKKNQLSQKTRKSVFCIEFNMTFDSLREAGRFVGIAYHHIKACCEGKQSYAGKHPNTNEPLHWHYTDSLTLQND